MKAKILGVLAAVACVFGSLLSIGNAYAVVTCPPGSIRGGSDGTGTANSYAECNLPVKETNERDLMDTVVTVINVIVGVVGVVAVAVIVIGAIFFVISTGEAAKTTRARNTILYGVVGLVISLLAFAIVNFVLTSVFKASGGAGSGGDEGGDSDGHVSTSLVAEL